MKTVIYFLKASLVFLVILLLLTNCDRNSGKEIPDPGFTRYLSSFTSGEISAGEQVVIRLKQVSPEFRPEQVNLDQLISLKPEVKGKVIYRPEGEFVFQPEKRLSSGEVYTVTFLLGKLTEVEKPYRKLQFSFRTRKQDCSLEEEGVEAVTLPGAGFFTWKGVLRTADVAGKGEVTEMVKAYYNGKPVTINWMHEVDQLTHVLVIDSLMRDQEKSSELKVEWSGKPIGVRESGKITVAIPGRAGFSVMGSRVANNPEQKITVSFSDPLDPGQSPVGLAELGNNAPFVWQVESNRLTLWPSEKITGETTLTLFRGLRSTGGKSLQEKVVIPLNFQNFKPEIRLLGKGVIVPDQGSMTLPFEAVSLRAIDLRIIKIYAANVRQFLQDNQVDGDNELVKVGRLVYKGKVDLHPPGEADLFKWSTYKLELNDYIKPEQGDVYRVELRFRKAYSLFACGNREPGSAETPDAGEEEAEEMWDAPGWYSLYYWPDDYEWKERDNPCHNSYFTSNRFVSRNIFASNLGIVAKEGKGFRFTFAVTSLDKAFPEEKAEISVFDFQQQLLGKCTTNGEGMASITLERKPFVAVAQKGNQTGYLRLDDGSSLSLSSFDVSGETIQEGVKGFIYGERGVWRPGDQIYLTFILDDPENRLPENIPVILKVTNSRGQEVVKRVATGSENGFYHFPVETHPDDPTGNWYARIQVGGAVFEKRLKIETVKPNRLKIDLQLPQLVKAGVQQQAPLRAEWLHGAVASSLKTIVETEIFPGKTEFRGYEKFHFDHPGVTWFPSKQVLFEGRLDQNGVSAVPLNFPSSTSYPGKMKIFFTTRVFEEGGDFSINVQQSTFSPYKKYLGIRMPDEEDGWYSTGKTYLPEVIALTPEGNPAPLGRVEVSLYKIDWRWWWESGDDYLARYVTGNSYQPLKRWSLQTSSSAEKFNLTVAYNNWNDNGRYLLYARDPENGHACGVTFYVSEWGGWRSDALPEGATILAVQTEKEKFNTGEKMKVKMPSSPGSRALVSLENGSGVKDIFWVKCTANETEFEVDIKEGMAPTLYIYVTLIQPYGSALNDAPIRLYGVHHVSVEDPATLLQPEIRMSEELEPEKEFSVTIREKEGKPMTYTIAVVDEGLLDLTGFNTPDPHGAFYAREALGVKTWDMFDYVAGAYGARLEKAFATGGDEERLMAGRKQSSRFTPVVLYAGPFTMGKGASKTHQFRMPAYVGSVKTMVIAGSSGAFGNADKTARVRKSVMLLTTAPRMAGPGETFSLPVEVFAMKEDTRSVTVRISGNDLVTPEGSGEQSLTFSQPGSKIARFMVKTALKTGIARIKVTAVAGNETSVQETELEIRNPNPAVVDEKDKILEKGATWEAEMNLPGMPGSNIATMELSSVPGLNLSGRLEELISYPHGCAEQTVSIALGQLFLGDLTELKDEFKVQSEANIKAAIQQLRGMQTATGGFAYWPGQNAADDWCSSYAGHFLLLSAQKGYMVPEEMKRRWIGFQVNRARSWKPAVNAEPFVQHQENLIQAYRLYTLALAGTPETGVMNRFREEITGFADARWRLAAAYLLIGQNAAANQLITLMPDQKTIYENEGPTYGTPLRDKALILETLLLKNDRKAAFRVVSEMAQEIGNSAWLSTQTAAWSFYAIARYFSNEAAGQGIRAAVTLNGKKENVASGMAVVKLPVSLNGSSQVKATVVNNGTGILYARLVTRGIPLEDHAPEIQRNVKMETLFTDRNGQPLNPESLPQGSDLFLQVSVSHPGVKGKYRNLALTTIMPSGWEILNSRIQDIPGAGQGNFDYQDIRDDRVYTYFELRPAETKKFRFALHAAYSGKYILPATVVEGMYDNDIYARIPGKWVSVK